MSKFKVAQKVIHRGVTNNGKHKTKTYFYKMSKENYNDTLYIISLILVPPDELGRFLYINFELCENRKFKGKYLLVLRQAIQIPTLMYAVKALNLDK